MSNSHQDKNRLPVVAALVTLLGAMAGTAAPAFAATSIATCGFTISAPGNYSLTADLVNCPMDGIDVIASGVSLTLNGHKISGAGNGAGVYLNAEAVHRLDHIAVQGPALIQGFHEGVAIAGTDYSQVDLVTVMGNYYGISAGGNTYLTVASNVATLNVADGIRVGSNYGTVTNNATIRNGSNGIVITGIAISASNNVANGNTYGIQVDGWGTRVTSNVTRGNTIYGIFIVPGASAQVFSNTSSVGNGTDLVDSNAACGSDFWGGNVFFTSSPSTCVK